MKALADIQNKSLELRRMIENAQKEVTIYYQGQPEKMVGIYQTERKGK